jgi:hypothetical protein
VIAPHLRQRVTDKGVAQHQSFLHLHGAAEAAKAFQKAENLLGEEKSSADLLAGEAAARWASGANENAVQSGCDNAKDLLSPFNNDCNYCDLCIYDCFHDLSDRCLGCK